MNPLRILPIGDAQDFGESLIPYRTYPLVHMASRKKAGRPPTTGKTLRMRRVITVYNEIDFAELQRYATRKGFSIYRLAKTAIEEYRLRHP